VYMISGGVTKFARARPDADFRLLVKEAFDRAVGELPGPEVIEGAFYSYFADYFTRQLMAEAMVHDYLGLCPKPSRRIEGGGASGGLCLQTAWETVASGRMEVCAAVGFETMSRVSSTKGNEVIALASDTNFDFPAGGFYTGYYAMMAQRHIHEFGTTAEQMAMVAIKNHGNARFNPFAQSPAELTIPDVRSSRMVSTPLTVRDCSLMSDGAAVAVLASEDAAHRICSRPVKITGVGSASDTMRLADRPHGKVVLLPHEAEKDYQGMKYPGVHSFRGGRIAAKSAYEMANITDPASELDFVEIYDSYTSAEIQGCEDIGLCRHGQGGGFVESGAPFMPDIDYRIEFRNRGKWKSVPVNPSGGLLACGHAIGATGLMQAVFAFWQLQGSIGRHLGNETLQVRNARRGLVHTHGGTGTSVTVTIMEAVS
jgi:acetyl-CoA C-acetyltransferase